MEGREGREERVVEIELPALHEAQAQIMREAKRFNVLMCGRSFGKTALGKVIVAEGLMRGESWAWCAPTYKILDGAWRELVELMGVFPGFQKNEQKLLMSVGTGGTLEGWSLDSDDPARSRRYHGMVIDEAGLVPQLLKLLNGALRPTLARHRGTLWVFGTPKMRGDFVAMHALGLSGEPDWASWNKGMWDNPYIPPDEVEALRRSLPPDDFRREVMGLPADDGGNPFGYDAITACVQGADRELGVPVVWGWDVARSVDWTVGVALDAMGNVVRLERWQGVPWGETVHRILEATAGLPAWCDATGVGDPIVERLQELGMDAIPFVFSSKSKQSLMQRLAACIQMGEVSVPSGPLIAELESFTYQFTDTGTRYTAPSGQHDDCVMALALSLYGFDRVAPVLGAQPIKQLTAGADTDRWQAHVGTEDTQRVLSTEDIWNDQFPDIWG